MCFFLNVQIDSAGRKQENYHLDCKVFQLELVHSDQFVKRRTMAKEWCGQRLRRVLRSDNSLTLLPAIWFV